MKARNYISLLCLILGIAVCAAFGSRLTPSTFERQTIDVQVTKLTSLTKGTQAKLKLHQDELARLQKSAQPDASNLEKRQTQVNEATAQLKTLEKKLNEAQKLLPARQPPRERLTAWWSLAGWPFTLGCVLIIIGSLIARREEQAQHTQSAEEGGPLDLGVALGQLHDAVVQMSSSLSALTSDDQEQLEALRDELLIVQQEKITPIIESRVRAQATLGLTRYAEVYGFISQGERRLNRAWAALVDGHLGEARRSLDGAVISWRQAIEELTQKT
jgi:Skp family chaperone for outer membrane proteins